MKNYDIIGDIHGYAHILEEMLEKLGYSVNPHGYYSHDSRTAIFLGDFIDRYQGGQKAVIAIVRPMIENGSALAVMGNHEFNAISYHTYHSDTNEPLRSHSPGHKSQHQAFLDEYEQDEDELRDVINWFKTLPLFLELDEIRIIHACWNNRAINSIADELDSANCLTDHFLVESNIKNSMQFDATETLLKGLEVPLPKGTSFKDGYGKERYDARIKWWDDEAETLRDYAVVPPHAVDALPDVRLSTEHLGDFIYGTGKPVFFGHYWFSGIPQIQKQNVACLDYSVANKEKLVCYRWNEGETELSNDNFVMVSAE